MSNYSPSNSQKRKSNRRTLHRFNVNKYNDTEIRETLNIKKSHRI